MILSVRQDNLARAVASVSKAVDSRPALPVLANFLLEADSSTLRISATNLQLSISVEIGARVDQPGSITLPAKTFTDLVNNLSSADRVDMQLDTSNFTMLVRCGTSKANIKGVGADEYPPIAHGEQTDLAVDASLFKSMVDQTAFAAAKDDNRPILTGVYTLFEGNKATMVCADGYRLSVRTGVMEHNFNRKVELVIPAKAMQEVARAIDGDTSEIGITLPSKRDVVTFHLPNMYISSQILEGRFPDFAAIIPRAYVTSSVLSREDLLKQCKRAEIFSRDNAYSGRFYLKPPSRPGDSGSLIVTGKSAERGDTDGTLDAHVEGEALDISFNIKYLIDVLSVMPDEQVVFQSNGAENPGVIRADGRDDFVHVIMPMSR